MRTHSAEAVRTGRWMARREEPFAVFLFGILKYALCYGPFSLVAADR
jgi:hypothetical protein